MKLSGLVTRILLAWAGLVAVQVIAGIIVPLKAPAVPNLFTWLVATDLLMVAVLSLVALRSDWRGLKLGLAVSAIPSGIAAVNAIEGSVFLTASGIDWQRLLAHTFLAYALAVPLWMLIFAKGREPSESHYRPVHSQSLAGRVWRFAASDFTYLFLYFLAGAIIFPYVKDFYATQTLPSPGKIAALQLLLRGPVFVAICLLLVRMVGLPRVSGALAVGAAFAILSGVAPLLMPNPYFPDSVRWVHFGEVTSSNFLFGAFVGWVWGQPKAAVSRVMSQAA
jgi:hypothetical protein